MVIVDNVGMSSRQHVSGAGKGPRMTPVPPAHRRQLERIEALTGDPVLTDEPVVDQKTKERAKKVVRMLWDKASPELEAVLNQAFITVIGGGDVQLEWEIDDRYFEVEIPAEGSLPYYFEKGVEEEEASAPSPTRLVDIFRTFWNS